jgi:hypothetical protein
VSGFEDRYAAGVAFEKRVMEYLRCRGWHVEPFGQALLTDAMHRLLTDVETPVRWMADLVASKRLRDRTAVRFIDAKAGEVWRQTGNHCIETAALDAALKWETYSGASSWFVFSDKTAIRPGVAAEVARPGRRISEFRTPYILISRVVCTPVDDVFPVDGETDY